ncbi:MAG: glycosyltransferase family 2 protein [Flavobacteriaceae bacterium]|nr:glycosyltransferase family 2 protein [Flavobacteriaceae bacterium]
MQYAVKKEPTNSVPCVSIITPLFNAEKHIAQTLQSVQNQSYQNWEHIIVNDHSTDTSEEIVKNIAEKDPRIQLVSLQENKGAAFCRNHATELANGDYIAFLDSDDLWHSEKLSKQVDFMKDQDCDVSYTSYLHISETGEALGKRIKALDKLPYKKQLRNNYIGNLTGIYNASTLGKIFAPPIRKRQDWAVWLEAIKKSGKPALGLVDDLAYYRVREGSMSSNKLALIPYNFKFYRSYLGYSWLGSVFQLLRFFWEYFLVRPKQIQKL